MDWYAKCKEGGISSKPFSIFTSRCLGLSKKSILDI